MATRYALTGRLIDLPHARLTFTPVDGDGRPVLGRTDAPGERAAGEVAVSADDAGRFAARLESNADRDWRWRLSVRAPGAGADTFRGVLLAMPARAATLDDLLPPPDAPPARGGRFTELIDTPNNLDGMDGEFAQFQGGRVVGTTATPGSGISGIRVEDEGAVRGSVQDVDFRGDGVTATAAAGEAVVTVEGVEGRLEGVRSDATLADEVSVDIPIGNAPYAVPGAPAVPGAQDHRLIAVTVGGETRRFPVSDLLGKAQVTNATTVLNAANAVRVPTKRAVWLARHVDGAFRVGSEDVGQLTLAIVRSDFNVEGYALKDEPAAKVPVERLPDIGRDEIDPALRARIDGAARYDSTTVDGPRGFSLVTQDGDSAPVRLPPAESGDIADGAVGTDQIADGAVESGKIADGAVDVDKLAADARQVQADAAETDPNARSFIRNKDQLGGGGQPGQGVSNPRAAGDGLRLDGNTLDVDPGDGIEIVGGKVAVDLDGNTLARGADGVRVNEVPYSSVTGTPTIPDAPADWAKETGATGTIPDARIPGTIARDSELPTDAEKVPAGGTAGQLLGAGDGTTREWVDAPTGGASYTDADAKDAAAEMLEAGDGANTDIEFTKSGSGATAAGGMNIKQAAVDRAKLKVKSGTNVAGYDLGLDPDDATQLIGRPRVEGGLATVETDGFSAKGDGTAGSPVQATGLKSQAALPAIGDAADGDRVVVNGIEYERVEQAGARNIISGTLTDLGGNTLGFDGLILGSQESGSPPSYLPTIQILKTVVPQANRPASVWVITTNHTNRAVAQDELTYTPGSDTSARWGYTGGDIRIEASDGDVVSVQVFLVDAGGKGAPLNIEAEVAKWVPTGTSSQQVDPGLDQDEVDARVAAGVQDWAEAGNDAPIPAPKLTNAPGAAGQTAFPIVRVAPSSPGTITFPNASTDSADAASAAYTAWQDVASHTITAAQAGQVIIDGHAVGVVSASYGGGDRIYFQARLTKTRGADTTVCNRAKDYGRNANNFGTAGYNAATREVEDDVLCFEDVLEADVIKMQVRARQQRTPASFTASNPVRTLTLTAPVTTGAPDDRHPGCHLDIAALGAKGDKGDKGDPGTGTAVPSGNTFPASPSVGDRFQLLAAQSVPDPAGLTAGTSGTFTGWFAGGYGSVDRDLNDIQGVYWDSGSTRVRVIRSGSDARIPQSVTIGGTTIALSAQSASAVHVYQSAAGQPNNLLPVGTKVAVNVTYTDDSKARPDIERDPDIYDWDGIRWVFDSGTVTAQRARLTSDSAPWLPASQVKGLGALNGTRRLHAGTATGISVSNTNQDRYNNLGLFARDEANNLYPLDLTDHPRGEVEVSATLHMVSTTPPTFGSDNQAVVRFSTIFFVSELAATGVYAANNPGGEVIGATDIYSGSTKLGTLSLRIERDGQDEGGYRLTYEGGGAASTSFTVQMDLNVVFAPTDAPEAASPFVRTLLATSQTLPTTVLTANTLLFGADAVMAFTRPAGLAVPYAGITVHADWIQIAQATPPNLYGIEFEVTVGNTVTGRGFVNPSPVIPNPGNATGVDYYLFGGLNGSNARLIRAALTQSFAGTFDAGTSIYFRGMGDAMAANTVVRVYALSIGPVT